LRVLWHQKLWGKRNAWGGEKELCSTSPVGTRFRIAKYNSGTIDTMECDSGGEEVALLNGRNATNLGEKGGGPSNMKTKGRGGWGKKKKIRINRCTLGGDCSEKHEVNKSYMTKEFLGLGDGVEPTDLGVGGQWKAQNAQPLSKGENPGDLACITRQYRVDKKVANNGGL